MRKVLAGLAFVLATSVAWAVPSEQQVKDAIGQGNYTQAQSMMAEVVADKPNSAKAHYIYAEVLARNGAFGKASEEAAKARTLDPKIGFTDPEKFRSFEQTLTREQNQVRPTRTSTTTQTAPSYGTSNATGGGIPGWVWLVGLLVIGVMLYRGFMRSRAAAAGGGPATYGSAGPAGMNPGYGPGGAPYGPGPGGYPAQPGRGSGLLGTGLAVAGGVAGGMMLGEMLHRHDGAAGSAGSGLIPDASASELENRSIDFGNGNDWDSGGGGGGSFDMGGGGDSGGSWD